MLSDIVNDCTSVVANVLISNRFMLEEIAKSESEDLLNNNEASKQNCVFNQRSLTSEDSTSVECKASTADNPKESYFTSSEDRNGSKYKETLVSLHDLSYTADWCTEQARRYQSNLQLNGVLSYSIIKQNNILGNNEVSQGEQIYEELSMDLQHPSKAELLKLLKIPEYPEESFPTDCSLGDTLNKKECLEINDFSDATMSVSDMLKSDLFDKATTQTVELPVRSQDLLEGLDHKLQDCDKTNHTSKCDANGFLNGSQCEMKHGKHKTTLSAAHLDLHSNPTVWESEEGTRNCSLDFQTKRVGACLPKTDGTNRGNLKTEHQPLKGRRLLPVSPELEFVEEEDLSENEESSEEDNADNALHFRSKDGLDHKKERHQYVSDKLDPDVLHLLEMHLRKQQLVDIKEEGEEEHLDVHVNKEKSRSDSYKLLRNISPVLDMVLEEPELEHAGDLLEGSKTPSDIDSDDSSNVSAIEVDLIESLQNDLMSKSSKIDKHEIATILQGPEPDILSRGKKTKIKEGSSYLCKCKSTNGNIQRKEPKTPITQRRDSGDLEIIHEDGFEDVGPDIISEDVNSGAHDIANIQLLPQSSVSSSLQQHGTLNETETTETLLFGENFLAETGQVDQCSKATSLDQDLFSDITQQTILEADTRATHMESLLVREKNSFHDTETPLPDSVKAVNGSGSPCPTLNGNVKPPVACFESAASHMIKEIDNPSSNDGGAFTVENDSSEQQDVVDTALSDHLTDLNKDLKVIKETVKSQTEPILSEAPSCSTAGMNTLQADLEQKILSLLHKAHAADCRSSHLQAEAELLFKESTELRNECKSLSKEAAELLSLFTQQGLLHRHQIGQSIQKSEAEGSVRIGETKPRDKTALSFVTKRNPRNKKLKGENQLQMLSKKYDFIREEGPEIMRELHVLQQDLKNVPPHHSKPINVLYKWLWGGLIAGGAMFLVLWGTKQLG